jgi:hypothetical protein
VRTQIRKLLKEAQRPSDPITLGGSSEPSLRLASETIRLARLAASTHMILSCRLMTADTQPRRLAKDTP